MLRRLQTTIDNTTMYRVAVYCLSAIVATAILASIFNYIAWPWEYLVLSLDALLIATYLSSRLLAHLFKTQHNPESWLITALILLLIMTPASSMHELANLALVGAIAMASKYIIAINHRHIANPAAIAALISGLLGLGYAIWWVATPTLLPAIVISGFIVSRKLRVQHMTSIFFAASFGLIALVSFAQQQPMAATLVDGIISWPILFMAAFMLTEPLTSPSDRRWQNIYALTVGVLVASQIAWWLTPELALVIGNMLVFATRHQALNFRLEQINQIGPHTYQLLLATLKPLHFQPGQFIELQLPHPKSDYRGVRRMFSIASADENKIVIATNLPEQPSTFKQSLITTKPGTILKAVRLGGDFVLPQDDHQPIVLVAGGIGITPFLSMIAANPTRPLTLIHCATDQQNLLFQNEIQQAKKLNYIPLIGNNNFKTIRTTVKKMTNPLIYISGSPGMVNDTKKKLRQVGVPSKNIKTDLFVGY